MKKSLLTLAIGSLCAGSAFAQTSVTLYGIVDQSIRYQTNADAGNHSQTQVTNGAITNSRWGLKGAEALGNNLKAIFQLENGFDPDTGRANQGGSLFGRQAYVGLSGDFGAVKLGRQYTEGFNFFGDYDPLTIGNYDNNAWPFFLTQFRNNNVISYSGAFSGLSVGASYGFGEVPGSQTKNQYWGTRAAYEFGPFGIGGVYQEIKDINSNKQQMWGVAGKYTIGPAKLFLGYLGGKDRTGLIDANFFTPANSANPIPAGGSAQANPRKDAIGYAGVTYQVTPALAVTGVFYGDHIKNAYGVADNSGNRYTGVLLAEYSLSKRTQVYGTVDYNKVTGGAQAQLPGKNNQTGVAAGIRHIF
ncbi:porin [Cupriavidus plantarum]|uniref:porin n=1 Tax=Cupriavidus plantarum TaxID=942865 RepID=UPI000E229D8E|nr:porin [Cupriavidus plantarum]NYH97512.1 putative porin [Cupriavidus plantarum]REE92517.1 putative porin [Cupriavidus plantarum]RLK36066.1 putative porin [Cupriavidus plantarum]CAG2150610.1 Outer membrane porin protein [Cupriavidus plantarum]SMR67886.1 Outer membrane protein (porin) [Cupriavidus plantarum]